jgi:antitoxin component YwqK of YwqJK toxin-antitoxin module
MVIIKYIKTLLCQKNQENLLETGLLLSTKKQGVHIKFFKGDTSEIIPFKNGVKDGIEIMYNHFTNQSAYTKWVNGNVETYKVYKNKTILVNDQKYYENGDSYWVFYYENGKVQQTTNTIKDTIYVVKYNEDGRINSVGIQLNSTQNIFYCNLKFNTCRVENFTQYLSKTESTLREYHLNGRLKSEMIWDKGKMLFSSFDETGRPIK